MKSFGHVDFYFFSILFLLLGFSTWLHAAPVSLAVKLPYVADPPPNYRLGALPEVPVLTDGRYANTYGRFWTQETTAGWESRRLVKMTIDLGAARNLEKVALTVVSGTSAGVRFPVASYVFVSEDQQNWVLGGCVRHVASRAGVASDGEIRERLALPLGNLRARFVQFYAVPAGDYFFTDEIDVLPVAAGSAVEPRPVRVSGQELAQTVDALRHRDWSRYLAASRDGREAGATFVDCAGDAVVKTRGPERGVSVPRAARSVKEAVGVKVEPCIDDERITADKGCAVGTGASREREWLRLGSRQYRAFRVGVNGGGVVRISARSRNGKVRAAVFEVPYVQALNGEHLADPLLPIDGALHVEPGRGGVVVLELDPTSPGQDQVELTIGSGEKAWRHSYAVDVVKLDEENRLYGNVWPYLDWPLVADRKGAAAQDLARHGADVLVVPYRNLPLPGTAGDFLRLREQLSAFGKPRIVLLYMGVDQRGSGASNPWLNADSLANWLRGVYQTLDGAGVAREKVYLYPVDEPHGSSLEVARKFVTLVKANHPEVRLYSTVSVPAAFALLPDLDIAQVLDRNGMAEAAKKRQKGAQQLWLYAADGPAKLNDPYAYYRLMGWRAFAVGASGVGFWNYADTQRGAYAGDGWDDIDSGRDFSVVYRGEKGSIVDGRRWEAFSLGLDDYQVLRAYQRIFGDEKSRRVVSAVLDGKTPGQAEISRQRMLREMAERVIPVK